MYIRITGQYFRGVFRYASLDSAIIFILQSSCIFPIPKIHSWISVTCSYRFLERVFSVALYVPHSFFIKITCEWIIICNNAPLITDSEANFVEILFLPSTVLGSFHPVICFPITTIIQVYDYPPFYSWGNSRLERLSNLSKPQTSQVKQRWRHYSF